MGNLILAGEILVGVALTVAILVQAKGTGVSAVFGGEGGAYRSRRGVEKILHRLTIILAFVFMALALTNLLTTQ